MCVGNRRHRSVAVRQVRAVISSDDKSVGTLPSQPAVPGGTFWPSALPPADAIDVRLVLTVRNRIKERLVEKIENQWEYFVNGIGQGIRVQLISEEVDPGG